MALESARDTSRRPEAKPSLANTHICSGHIRSRSADAFAYSRYIDNETHRRMSSPERRIVCAIGGADTAPLATTLAFRTVRDGSPYDVVEAKHRVRGIGSAHCRDGGIAVVAVRLTIGSGRCPVARLGPGRARGRGDDGPEFRPPDRETP